MFCSSLKKFEESLSITNHPPQMKMKDEVTIISCDVDVAVSGVDVDCSRYFQY